MGREQAKMINAIMMEIIRSYDGMSQEIQGRTRMNYSLYPALSAEIHARSPIFMESMRAIAMVTTEAFMDVFDLTML